MKNHLGALALAAAAITSLGGCALQALNGDPVPRESYAASATAGGQAMAARARFTGWPAASRELVIAPVQCTFEFTDTAYIGQYNSFQRPEFMRNDTTAILRANPSAQAVLFTQVRALMRPTSLSQLDGLGMMNYPIYAQLNVRACTAPGSCSEMVVDMQDPSVSKLADFTLPIVRATEKDKSNFKEVNQLSRDLFDQAVTAPILAHWGKLAAPQQ